MIYCKITTVKLHVKLFVRAYTMNIVLKMTFRTGLVHGKPVGGTSKPSQTGFIL